ncbi:MAG: tannase/feruloyl esterase family alpha/beta hydrolase, partial [Rhodospirillaceae bacterium]|nr:tannase/feruloyl esterase family alpha/beta hydrolase [Rhodospirillaceae bacterium]
PAGQGIDLLTAMEAWVEDGRAPSQLIATTKGEERARMLYPYPSYGAYGGEGDPSRAESYVEKRPNRN